MSEGHGSLDPEVIIIVPTASVGTGIIVSPINGDGGVTAPGIGNRSLKFCTAHNQITRRFNRK